MAGRRQTQTSPSGDGVNSLKRCLSPSTTQPDSQPTFGTFSQSCSPQHHSPAAFLKPPRLIHSSWLLAVVAAKITASISAKHDTLIAFPQFVTIRYQVA